MYDGRVTVNSKRSSGGAINIASGYPGVNQGDDPTSRGVGGGEVNSMRSEDLLKSSKVIVRGARTSCTQTTSYLSRRVWRWEMTLK